MHATGLRRDLVGVRMGLGLEACVDRQCRLFEGEPSDEEDEPGHEQVSPCNSPSIYCTVCM
jgi:hypothetical protein